MAKVNSEKPKAQNDKSDEVLSMEEMKKDINAFAENLKNNFAIINEMDEEIQSLKKGTVLKDGTDLETLAEKDIKAKVNALGNEKGYEELNKARRIVECMNEKKKAYSRNGTLKKKLGEFIDDLYNDVIKKIDELGKEIRDLRDREKNGEKLSNDEKKRMLEIERELKVLRKEADYLEKEMKKLRKEIDSLLGEEKSKNKDTKSKKGEGKDGKSAPQPPKEESEPKDKDTKPKEGEGKDGKSAPQSPKEEGEPKDKDTKPKKGDRDNQNAPQPQVMYVPGGAMPAASGNVKNKEVNNHTDTKVEGETPEPKDTEEKDLDKERYLKFKDICDRMQKTEEALESEGKEPVTKEEIEELDTEFKEVYNSMLEDSSKTDKWDKRILACMLGQERYYQDTAEEKRAEYYIKTKLKFWEKLKAKVFKKSPADFEKHKNVLSEMKDFIEKDKTLESDFAEASQRDEIKAFMRDAINSWESRVGSEFCPKEALPLPDELADDLAKDVKKHEDIDTPSHETDRTLSRDDMDSDHDKGGRAPGED